MTLGFSGRLPALTLVAASLAASLLGTAGCTQRGTAVATAPVVDPYVDTGDGGARYSGDVTVTNRAGVLPGTPSQQTFAAAAGSTVLFAQDQVVLTAEAQAIVARQADWLAKNKDFLASVEGHADEQGTREYNLALGARRAASVQEMLIARGVEPGRISTVSYGNERPVEACTPEDEACLARNRRAVTAVTPGASGV